MSNLFASFTSAANTLNVLQQALQVTQNNVNNASTPGYARQSLGIESLPMDVATGLAGGIGSGGLIDSRDQFAEQQVQMQTSALGMYTAQEQATNSIQTTFDVTGNGGVSSELSALLREFSAWASTPGDSTARQNVLNGAQNLAQAINTVANSLSQTANQLNSNVRDTVSQINNISGEIQQWNINRRTQTQSDPGSDAQLYGYLQDLSSYTNFSSVQQSDGTVTILLAGGSPLVVGTQQYGISASVSADGFQILDSNTKDVTSQITGGQLGGLLDTRNRVLASILGTSTQQGTLNQFAQAVADTVNGILTSGTVSTDTGAASGSPLFQYNSGDPNGDPNTIAATFEVNPTITPDQLAPVDSAGNSNGNANALAALSDSTATVAALGGQTLLGFYGQVAADAGREYSAASNNASTQQQVLAQAKNLRDQASGVNLDEEAASVLQFQRSYQAAAQVLTVINQMIDNVLNMIPQ
jgi:flagellar hook-associated protein 1 FlgK